MAAAKPWFKIQPPVERRVWEEILNRGIHI